MDDTGAAPSSSHDALPAVWLGLRRRELLDVVRLHELGLPLTTGDRPASPAGAVAEVPPRNRSGLGAGADYGVLLLHPAALVHDVIRPAKSSSTLVTRRGKPPETQTKAAPAQDLTTKANTTNTAPSTKPITKKMACQPPSPS